MSDSHGNGENSSRRNDSQNGNHSRPVTPQGQPRPGYYQARQRPGPSRWNGNSSGSPNFGNGNGSGHHFEGTPQGQPRPGYYQARQRPGPSGWNGNSSGSPNFGNGNGSGRHFGNGSSSSRSNAASPNYFENRAGSSGSGSSIGRQPSQGSNSPAPSHFGEKRGRDRSQDSSGGRDKFQKRHSGAAAGNGRKRREEFIDQIKTRPESVNKEKGSDKKAPPMNDAIIDVAANYFRVNAPEISVTVYRVDFEPETDVPGIRRRLIFQNKPRLGGYVFDGGCEIFLLRPLGEIKTVLPATTREGEEFTIHLKETGTVHYTEARFLQVMNLVLRNGMRGLNLQLVGRNFFDANQNVVIDIPQFRLQIWPGYDTSIRQHEDGLLLNCDTRHKVMRQENVWSIIVECRRENGGNFQEAAERKIIGYTVLTDYNNATYKISDIDWDQTPADTFPTKAGPVSFAEYYKTKYNLQIKENQPLLVSKASARNIRAGQAEYILLVPELCRMTGLTDADRSNTRLMCEMAKRTSMTPTDRVRRLELFARRMNETPACRQVFDESRMPIERNLVRFQARRFKYEKLQLAEVPASYRDFVTLNEKADWTGSMQKSMFKVVLGEELKNWFFVFPRKFKGIADGFMGSFMEAAEGFMAKDRKIRNATAVQLNDDRTSTYEREIKQILRQDPSFLMVVIPRKDDEVYSVLKKMTIGQSSAKPVAIQVVTAGTCKHQRLLSVATKVVIQVNCKLGGIPWLVNLKDLTGNTLTGLMIVGFDISIAKGRKRDTYGAMVASLNPENNGGHYFSMAKRHTDGTMLSTNFGIMIRAALMRYRKCNEGALPKAILIYRDGVGDGDLAFVNDQEVKNIRSAVSSMYGGEKEAKFAFVIVNKKSNTRIMQQAREGSREPYCNPLPGTVIDDVITLPERIDFYLISQSVNQGTVAPVYYNVLFNEFSTIRILQQMSYKLCHNYFNWTGTVRVPSVVQYAKKLAMLAQDTLNGAPSEEISNKQQLYFL